MGADDEKTSEPQPSEPQHAFRQLQFFTTGDDDVAAQGRLASLTQAEHDIVQRLTVPVARLDRTQTKQVIEELETFVDQYKTAFKAVGSNRPCILKQVPFVEEALQSIINTKKEMFHN